MTMIITGGRLPDRQYLQPQRQHLSLLIALSFLFVSTAFPGAHALLSQQQQQQQLKHVRPSTATTTTTSISSSSTQPESCSTASTTPHSPSFVSSSTSYNNNNNNNNNNNMVMRGNVLRQLVIQAAQNDVSETVDLTGFLWMEHVNLIVGSRTMAEYFYLTLLGCSKDASKSFHVNLGQQQFHLAERKTEKGETAQRIAGSIGLAVPSLDTIRARIPEALEVLKDTEFAILHDGTHDNHHDDNHSHSNENTHRNHHIPYMTLTCPWGNIFHLYDVRHDDDYDVVVDHDSTTTSTTTTTESASQQQQQQQQSKMVQLHKMGAMYGSHRMAIRGGHPGIRFVEITCPPKTASAIAEFYTTMIGCTVFETTTTTTSTTTAHTSVPTTVVSVGPGVHLVFVEQIIEQEVNDDTSSSSSSSLVLSKQYQAMKGVHICFYVHDFEAVYHRLASSHHHGSLIWTNPRFVHLDSCDTWEEAKASRTLRFKDIVDLSTGKVILELEHETRPLRHGQYLKVPFYEPK